MNFRQLVTLPVTLLTVLLIPPHTHSQGEPQEQGGSDIESYTSNTDSTPESTGGKVRGWAHEGWDSGAPLKLVEISNTSKPSLSNNVVTIVREKGSDPISLDFKKDPRTGQFELNTNKKEDQASAIDAFVLVNQAHKYFSETLAIGALNDSPALTVIIDSKSLKCTAGHEETRVLIFSKEDQKCRSSVDPRTVFHEYTHLVDTAVLGRSNIDLAEGLADMAAAFMTNNPDVVDSVKGSTKVIRSVKNKIKFNYQKIHSKDDATLYQQGLAWAGFAWDAREALIEKYGPSKGKEIAEELFFKPLTDNAKTVPEAVQIVMKTAEPGGFRRADYDILVKAAKEHGFKID